MCIACQHVLILEHWSGHGFTFGIIDLSDGLGGLTKKLGVMEFVTPILTSIKHETSIAKGDFAVGLSGCNLVRQDSAHGIFAIVGDDALAQIHHAATFCHDAPSPFGIVTDAFPRLLCLHQCIQMFFRISPRQVEQVTVAQVGHIFLWIEESEVLPSVKVLLVVK